MARNQQLVKVSGDNVSNCPVCGSVVRLIYRDEKWADHYEPLHENAPSPYLLPIDQKTAKKLGKLRNNKKTVALVGMSPTSCALAPYEDKRVEIWSLNETHVNPWLKRWDRWFQMHREKSFTRDIAARDVEGHYDWLQKKHDKPISMLFMYSAIPDSQAYPLREICERFLSKVWRGDSNIKYFTSSFDYMLALALYLDFDRIEIYGFEMSLTKEYIEQKPGASFWLGMAAGLGKEIYTPPGNQLLNSKLYGYEFDNLKD